MSGYTMGKKWTGRRMFAVWLAWMLMVGTIAELLILAPTAGANSARTAEVMAVTGSVQVKKSGGSKTFSAFEGMFLNQGDHISTEAASSVRLKITDREEEVTIGENAEMYISALTEEEEGKQSKLKLWAGTLWFKVKTLVSGADEFEIETPTAVMGVRGSHGLMQVDPEIGANLMLMLSGVLKDVAGSDEGLEVYPGFQVTALPSSGPDEPPVSVLQEVDIEQFIVQASPEIIEVMLVAMADIREENAVYLQQLAEGSRAESGLREIGSTATMESLIENLNNLIDNIVAEAVKAEKLSPERAGAFVNLEQVKPYQKGLGISEEKMRQADEQKKRLEEQRERLREQQQEKREQVQQKMESTLTSISEARDRLQQRNAEKAKEAADRAAEAFKNSLSDAEKERFEQERQQLLQKKEELEAERQQRIEQEQKRAEGTDSGQPSGSPQPEPQPSGNGNTGGVEEQPAEEADREAPAMPELVSPLEPVSYRGDWLLSVRAESGAEVRVILPGGGIVASSAASSSNTNMTVSLPSGIYDGLQVVAVNGYGVSPMAALPQIIVDRTEDPTIVAPLGPTEVGPHPEIVVKAAQGATVKVYNGEVLVGSGMGSGHQEVTIPLALTEPGSYSNLRVTAGIYAELASTALPTITIVPEPVYVNGIVAGPISEGSEISLEIWLSPLKEKIFGVQLGLVYDKHISWSGMDDTQLAAPLFAEDSIVEQWEMIGSQQKEFVYTAMRDILVEPEPEGYAVTENTLLLTIPLIAAADVSELQWRLYVLLVDRNGNMIAEHHYHWFYSNGNGHPSNGGGEGGSGDMPGLLAQ